MAEENEAVMAEVMNLLEAEPVAALPAARPDIPALRFLSFSRKALSLVVRLKDTEALQNDNLAPRCGRLLAVANAFLITAKHVNFQPRHAPLVRVDEVDNAKQPQVNAE